MIDNTEIKVEEREPQAEDMDELVSTANTSTLPDVIPCPICQEPIMPAAKKCKHCGDYLDQGWSGFKGKTLWDVLGLIVIPLTLALVGFFLANMQDSRQIEIEDGRIAAQSTVESNRARSNALQAYLDDMSDVILHEDLENQKTQSAMRARTIATISELDGKRNAVVVIFLYEIGMLNQLDLPPINLSNADLRSANLSNADLRNADLYSAILSDAHLRFANLNSANLSFADLRGADLRDAHLNDAHLSGADLRGADLRNAHLNDAHLSGADLCGADLRGVNLVNAFLFGATHNNATNWPEDFEPIAAGVIYLDEVAE